MRTLSGGEVKKSFCAKTIKCRQKTRLLDARGGRTLRGHIDVTKTASRFLVMNNNTNANLYNG